MPMPTRYHVSPGVVSTVVDGEVTLLDPRSGVYFGLQDSAARVWELLAQRPTVEALVAALTEEFEVSPDTCGHDVRALLDDLGDRGLIETRND